MTDTAMAIVDTEALEFEAAPWLARARALVIVDQESYGRAAEFLLGIKALATKIDQDCDENIRQWHEGHKKACAKKNHAKAPLLEAEATLKQSMAKYQREEDERRRKEEARLRAIALKAEEDARLEEAAWLEAEGEPELAQHVLDLPPMVAPPAMPPPPKVDGIATRKLYRAECRDVRALCRAIADGTAAANLVTPNQTALNQMAVALKEHFAVPGCQVTVETSVAAARR